MGVHDTPVIRAGGHRRVRWANGRGWTRELVRTPDVDDWDWRLSLAESDGAAPFSTLPGVDRELVLVRGAGLVLRFADGEVRELRAPYDRLRFAGERAVVGEPVAGPTEQLNLMWRRDRVAMAPLLDVREDERLLRHRAGTARRRASDEPLDTVEPEAAIARTVGELRIPVSSLLRGADTERQASFVRTGNGTTIVRNGSPAGHGDELLGTVRGEHRRLECRLVTLTATSETHPPFRHPGSEFLYLLEGTMDYGHGPSTYRLEPGDSLQLDGEGARGPVDLVQVPIRFLSVIAFPDAAG